MVKYILIIKHHFLHYLADKKLLFDRRFAYSKTFDNLLVSSAYGAIFCRSSCVRILYGIHSRDMPLYFSLLVISPLFYTFSCVYRHDFLVLKFMYLKAFLPSFSRRCFYKEVIGFGCCSSEASYIHLL